MSAATSRRSCSASACSSEPRILILDEPTRGVDVGARHAIHYLDRVARGAGVGIILISSDLEEVLDSRTASS